MRIHVITACTRPRNLPALAESIVDAACEGWEVCWHVLFDLERAHVGGQRPKNHALDAIADGWVCFLDDDTLMHPLLIETVSVHHSADAVVVSQERADGRTLVAARENVKVGRIDIGQAVIRRDVIGDERIPETYVGDGIFLENVLTADRPVMFVREVLSYHNALAVAA